MCCNTPIGGGGLCWLCPQCSIQTMIYPFPKYWVFGGDCLHLHRQYTAPLVIGIYLFRRHVKLKEQLPVLLLAIVILLHHFLQPCHQLIWCSSTRTEPLHSCIGLVPAQDVHYFYTRSHFSALQNCAVLFSTNFQIIFILKKFITQFSH